MSDPPLPGDEGRESIPLLLARTTRPPPAPDAKRPRTKPKSEAAAPPLQGVEWTAPGKSSRRFGAAGLLVATLLVLVAVFADLFASDLPIACELDGRVFVFPNVVRPPELDGLDRPELARRASWSVGALVAHGPRLAPGEDARPLLGPAADRTHPLGTDREGRDVFARIVHGARSYLFFALAAVSASLALGMLLGGVAGVLGGALDGLVGRAVESVSAFPPLVLVLGIQAAVPRPTVMTLFLAIALTRWPEIARLVRAEVLLASTRDYVLAARALGAPPLRVLRRHIVPNVRGPLVVAAAVGVSAVVLTEASLDFLRVGLPGGAASWGETMSEFRDAPHAWWLLAFPGALLVVTVIAYNLLGEAVRDAFDPRAD